MFKSKITMKKCHVMLLQVTLRKMGCQVSATLLHHGLIIAGRQVNRLHWRTWNQLELCGSTRPGPCSDSCCWGAVCWLQKKHQL